MLSSADIKTGETYTVTAGSQSSTVEMTDTIYGSGGMMGGHGGFRMERAEGGNAPDAQSSATV